MKYFPDSVQLNINDSDMHWDMTLFRQYLEIVRNLIDRGIRIDYLGMQMHIFNPEEARKIASGADILTPEKICKRLDLMAETGRPLHVSEVTISAPDNTDEGKTIQAEIAKNLYRLWFSHSKVMEITWWNVVDGGAAPGEPSISGLFDQELNPKPVYQVLDNLINHEWKTNLTVQTDKNGIIKFRGFHGKYKITWTDELKKEHDMYFLLNSKNETI
jgi:GH35 family endo-1,4-beta-xylanase